MEAKQLLIGNWSINPTMLLRAVRSLVQLALLSFPMYDHNRPPIPQAVPVDATAVEAKDISKTNASPLRILHTTITALVVSRQGFDNRLIGWRHLHHVCDELVALSFKQRPT